MYYGYGLKLVLDENLNSEINQYFSLYTALEIKFKQSHLNSPELIDFLNSREELYKNLISFHFEADLIKDFPNRKAYFYTCIKSIKNLNMIVTHMPNNIDNSYEALTEICTHLPENCILLLENTSGDSFYFEKYLKIKKTIPVIYSEKIKICLDLGHCENLEETLLFLSTNNSICNEIIELHLHSKEPCEHSKFIEYSQEIYFAKNIIKQLPNLNRIIFEIKNIDIFNKDGIDQISLFKI